MSATAAFEALVRQEASHVRRFLRACCRNPADAEDALQETFVALWKHLHAASDPPPRAWLFQVARNAARRQYRRRAGEPVCFEDVSDLQQLAADAGYGTEARVARRQAHDALWRAIGTLSLDDRAVLVLRDIEGLTGEETAAALGVTLAAQKSRLHRSRLRLMGALREGEGHGA